MGEPNWQEDHDCEEYAIIEVELSRDEGERGTWIVKLEYDFLLQWPRGGGAPQPRVGQTCRVFGDVDGVWGPRGVVIEDKVAYFRTPEDQVEWVRGRDDEVYKEATAAFKEHEEELRRRLADLPEDLRERIEARRKAAGDVERFDVFELGREIVKHEHGHMIALVMDTEYTLDTFSRIPNQGQMGYSWTAMCDERIEVINKLIESADATTEVTEDLQVQVAYLEKYREQRFFVHHDPQTLGEIFEISSELVQAEARH